MKAKLTDELITALLEVMKIPKSGYIEAALREKLEPLNPKHYTDVMKNLMDDQRIGITAMNKVSEAIQKSLDRYCHPKTVDELLSLFKRSYRGRVISDDCAGFNRGVKIAVSADGESLVNLYNGKTLNEAYTIEVIEWCLENPEKIGVDNKHVMIEQQSKLGSAYGDIVEQPLIGNVQNLIADISAQKRGE